MTGAEPKRAGLPIVLTIGFLGTLGTMVGVAALNAAGIPLWLAFVTLAVPLGLVRIAFELMKRRKRATRRSGSS